VAGNNTKVQVQSGAILTETYDISISSNTTLQIDNGGLLNHNVNSVTIFGGTESIGNSSTVSYGFAGAQTVVNATYGNLTLSGTGLKTISSSTVNGILSMAGTASASAAPTYGAGSTLQYIGSSAQAAGNEMPATFSGTGGIIINNPNGITLSGNSTVSSILTMIQGNINTGSFTLSLSNGLVSSLVYTSGTIIGRFRRSINTTLSTNYLFPVGTAGFYRPAVLNFSSIASATDITAEFVGTSPAGFVSYTDGSATLSDTFSEGFWRFLSSSLPAVNYSMTLTGAGFSSYTIDSFTRITGRDNGNTSWRALGTTEHGQEMISPGQELQISIPLLSILPSQEAVLRFQWDLVTKGILQ
jgi:hypothetical protein